MIQVKAKFFDSINGHLLEDRYGTKVPTMRYSQFQSC